MAGRGRPRGSPKTPGSGRKRGSLNKVTLAHRAALQQMKVDRTDPMSFFMSVLRNPDAPYEEVKAAARELLPYSHPKLASVEARSGGLTHEDRLAQYRELLSDDDEPLQLRAARTLANRS
jgi:hypothetical protein